MAIQIVIGQVLLMIKRAYPVMSLTLVQVQFAGVQRSNLQLLYPLQKLSMLLLPQQLVKQYGYGECFTDVGQKQEHRTTLSL